MQRALLFVVGAAALGCTVKQEQPNLVGQDIRLTFIHTSDIHSRLFPYNFVPNVFDRNYGLTKPPYGGIARIATIAKQIRKSSSRSLWLDTGDCFQGAPIFNMFKGEAEMRALSLAGMDGAVLGNHEFDLGAKNLFEKIDNWATFPLLAGNYAWDNPPPGAVNSDGRSLRDVIAPYAIYDVQGLKVGVIGMGNTSTITSIYEGGNNLGFRPLADGPALDGWVRLLRPQVDVIVVVSHLGLDEDEDLTASQVEDDPNAAFAQSTLAGVDVILGGHLHIVTNPPKVIPNIEDADGDGKPDGRQTVLVHSGAFAKFVGRLDMVVRVGANNGDPAQRSRVTSFSYTNIPVQSDVPEDAEITAMMWPYSVQLNQEIDLNGVFAFINSSNPGTGPCQPDGSCTGEEEVCNFTTNTCGEKVKVSRNNLGGGDSQLGNLVARSMQIQEGVEAELAITNSLGIRADFEYGPLTIEQMYNVFPFENSITVIYLSGQEIKDTLDFVAQRSATRGCRTQAQVAGISFDMVCAGPMGAHAKNIAIGDNCRTGGDPDAEIDFSKCAPLELSSLYRVAVNDYIAAGGSGFEVLRRNTSKQDTGISLRDSLRVFLNTQTCPAGSSCRARCDAQIDDSVVGVLGPKLADKFGAISCLDENVEAHDGRIRPTFE
jgi:2',3'-cyclic-nucleotide 2'-phosphodiesterase (5'-nucleotidase family)